MKRVLCIRKGKAKSYSYVHKWTDNPYFEDFKLHNHNDFEIFIFIKGDVNFVVEGRWYALKPYDMLIIRESDLHHIFHNSRLEYERIVINISEKFFDECQCTLYKDCLVRSSNLIGGEQIKASAILDIILRLEQYIKESTRQNDAIIKCTLVELLHNINKIDGGQSDVSQNERVAKIIKYINDNLSKSLSLDSIAMQLFISKYYMCRIFKKATGFSAGQYIITKRILFVKRLYREGKSLSAASLEAGFGSYSNFYKAYKKEFGMSPKKGLAEMKRLG